MRVLKWLLGVLVGVVVVFVAVGFVLPRNVSVARSIDINAPADKVFPHVNSLKASAEWSPWMGRDPDMTTNYTGPDEGVGAKLEWASEHPQVGNGSQQIVVSDPGKRVETDLDFGDMGLAKAAFLLDEAGGATKVTWTLDTDMGVGPVGRWMGLMMDSWVGGDYETGLSNLKALVESN